MFLLETLVLSWIFVSELLQSSNPFPLRQSLVQRSVSHMVLYFVLIFTLVTIFIIFDACYILISYCKTDISITLIWKIFFKSPRSFEGHLINTSERIAFHELRGGIEKNIKKWYFLKNSSSVRFFVSSINSHVTPGTLFALSLIQKIFRLLSFREMSDNINTYCIFIINKNIIYNILNKNIVYTLYSVIHVTCTLEITFKLWN